MKFPSWRTILRIIAVLAWLVSAAWFIDKGGYEPLIAFLTGTISFLASFSISDTPINRGVAFAFSPEQQQRSRLNMLQLVRTTWIEGVLFQSLHNKVLIELGLEKRPEAIEHPWDTVLKIPEQGPTILPPGTKIIDVCEQMGGALLILGEPGSGKTTMLLELTRQAIERALKDAKQTIPVVFNLSSWTPKQTITEWLIDELMSRYYVPRKFAEFWVGNDELMLLFDGLDEVKSDYIVKCIQAINVFREEHLVKIAVCCRVTEYEASVVGYSPFRYLSVVNIFESSVKLKAVSKQPL